MAETGGSDTVPVVRHQEEQSKSSGQRTALFWAAVTACFMYRLSVVWPGGAPSGYDPGNWLYVGRAMLGWGPNDLGLLYPPAVPVAVAVLWAVGGAHGVMLLGAVASVAPGVVGWCVWRRFRGGTAAALLLLVFCPFGEAHSWGGWPTLFGIAAMIGAIGNLDEWYRRGRKNALVWYGVSTTVMLATSHAVLLPFMLGVLVVTIVRVVEGCARSRELLRVALVSAVPFAAFAPLYVKLLSQVSASVEKRQAVARPSLMEMLTSQAALFNSNTRFLWLAMFFLSAAFLTTHVARYRALWSQALAFLAGTLLLALTREERFRFVVPVGVILAVGAWVGGRDRRASVPAVLCVVALLGAETKAMSDATVSNTRFYRGVNAELLEGARWLEENAPKDAVLATAADMKLSDGPWGWWVRGISGRRTLVGTAPRWVNFDSERADALVANHLFSHQFGSPEQAEAARESAVTHLVLTYRSEDFSSNITETIEEGDVVFSNDSMIVVKVESE